MSIFLLAGHEFDIDREKVEMNATNLQPEQILRRNYTVTVDGKVFPVKQLLAGVVNLPPAAFITYEACKVLIELGYDVEYNR